VQRAFYPEDRQEVGRGWSQRAANVQIAHEHHRACHRSVGTLVTQAPPTLLDGEKKGWKSFSASEDINNMVETVTAPRKAPSAARIQDGWHDLHLRVEQLEAEKTALEGRRTNSLRNSWTGSSNIGRKSHSELILLLNRVGEPNCR